MAGQEHALLIGNATFPQEPKLASLRCPLRDVDGLSDLLSSPDHGPYTVKSLKDQPSGVVRQEVYRVLTTATPDDTVLLYYSGHGKVDEDELYLITADTRLEWLPTTSVSTGDIKKFINKSRCGRIILVLDCCYSGAVVEGNFRGDVPDQVKQILPSNLDGRGKYILTASSDVELAEEREGDDYGLLTKHIILGIKNGAADRDDDGFVSMGELLTYVQQEVSREGRQKPRGHAIGLEDGEIKVARTGRAPRDQKRREVQRAVYETALRAHLPPRLIRPAITVIDPTWAQAAGTQIANDLLDRLHRACRNEADFMDALLQLPEVIAQAERPLQSEIEQARRRQGELETESESLRRRIAQLEAGRSQEYVEAAGELERWTQAHKRVSAELAIERVARARVETQLTAANTQIRELTQQVETRKETKPAPVVPQNREVVKRPKNPPPTTRQHPILDPNPGLGSDISQIAAEVRRQKELDDARRGVIVAQPADVDQIKAEMAALKKKDDERRARELRRR